MTKLYHSHKRFEASIASWINFGKINRVIKFNQKAWPKQYVDMNTKLRQKAKINF